MRRAKIYVGIDDDDFGGMTPNGNIIRDAWVFDLIPETEKCKGWSADRFQVLYDEVYAAWEPFGHMVGNLPKELRERHQRIHGAAFAKAKSLGWNAEMGDEE